MDLTDSLKARFIDTAQTLKGSARRVFMARTVQELGPGGQRRAERELGWSRVTIRKGTRELERGVPIQDNFAARGRKRAEAHLPNLLTDIRRARGQEPGHGQGRRPRSPARGDGDAGGHLAAGGR